LVNYNFILRFTLTLNQNYSDSRQVCLIADRVFMYLSQIVVKRNDYCLHILTLMKDNGGDNGTF